MDLLKCLRDLETAATKAGDAIKPYYGRVVDKSKDIQLDPVSDDEQANEAQWAEKTALTELDELAQQVVTEQLVDTYSHFGIHAEETNDELTRLESRFAHRRCLPEGKLTFVIDPIDGTRNFLNTNPKNHGNGGNPENCDFFAVCVNLAAGKEIIAGAFYFPAFQQLISCLADHGTWRNGEKVKLRERSKPSFDDPLRIGRSVSEYRPLFTDHHSYGSSCGNLLGLLSQEIDAYVTRKVDILDFGCTAVALREAGGFVGNFDFQEAELSRYVTRKIQKDGTPKITIGGFMALTPSREYYLALMEMLRGSDGNKA